MNREVYIDLQLKSYVEYLQKKEEEYTKVFDPIRKKFVKFTPEELTRQLLIQYFLKEKKWSPALISVEKEFKLFNSKRRYDLVLFKSANKPYILIECKSPNTKLDTRTFEQVANYNLALKIPFLLISNGHENYSCSIDFEDKKYTFLDHIPD